MAKLVAMDMDGTLTEKDGSIPFSLVQVLRDLSSKGVRFALATGRMTETADLYAKRLGGASVISYNGSRVRRSDGSLISKDIPLFIVEVMAAYCKHEGLYLQMYHDGKILAKDSAREFRSDLDGKIAEVVNVDDFTKIRLNPTPKCVIVTTEDRVPDILDDLAGIFGDKLYVTQSSPCVIEILPANVNKAYGLSLVAKDLGIRQEDVIAIGDGLNDLSMIEWAGTGVAVANAAQGLKDSADMVTEQCSSEGVEEALRKLFY